MGARALPLSVLSTSEPVWGGKAGRSGFLLFPVKYKPREPVPLPCVRKGRRNRWGGDSCACPRGGRDAANAEEDEMLGGA